MKKRRSRLWLILSASLIAVCGIAALVLLRPREGGEQAAPTASPTPEATASPTPAPVAESVDTAIFASLTPDMKRGTLSVKARIVWQNRGSEAVASVRLRLPHSDTAEIEGVYLNRLVPWWYFDEEDAELMTVAFYSELEAGEVTELFVSYTLSVPGGGGAYGFQASGLRVPNALITVDGEAADITAALALPDGCAAEFNGETLSGSEALLVELDGAEAFDIIFKRR